MADAVVIRGGTVIDGSGEAGYQADVKILQGHVAEIGPRLDGGEVFDADGLVVAPGFIDIHTHYDAQVFWDAALSPSCFHGVTSVVAGNCGFSLAPTRAEDRETMVLTLEKVEDMNPAALMAGVVWDFETFPEYLAAVRRRGTLLNFGAYLGHTPLRLYAMGDAASDRIASEDEVDRMVATTRQAMEAGALGFATSFAVTHRGSDGRPIPSRLADTRELEAICRAVADSGRGVIAVNGGEGFGFTATYEMQEVIGTPFTYTALLTTADGKYLKALEIHRRRRARGAGVWPQVSCRPLSFSMTLVEPFTLNTSPVFAELMGRSLGERRSAYGDPAWRRRVVDGWANGEGIVPRWDTFEVMESAAHPHLVGRRLDSLPCDAGSNSLDVLLDLALAEPDLLLRVRCVLANDDPEGVATLLNEDGCVLGLSDAGAHVSQLCDAALPTDLLGNWVGDRRALTLEKAVHKLTGEPAALFGFADRGVLRQGARADVVVFDPASIGPGPIRRVRDFPAASERLTSDSPTGIERVYVNGSLVLDRNHLVESTLDELPGQQLVCSPR